MNDKDTKLNCNCFHRSKSRNISAEELFNMMQYLGRLYDHDPDNIKKMKELHNILTDKDPNYDVDSMMKNVSPVVKSSSTSPCLLPFSSPQILLLAIDPLPNFGFFALQNGSLVQEG
jgi:hypothetical protein